jgi:hypothetical protein
MFGYYAVLCWKIEPFWDGLRASEDDPYWTLLYFVWRMKINGALLEALRWPVVLSLRV